MFEKASTGRVPLTAHPAPKFQASSPTKPFAEKSSPQLPRPRATPREVPRNFHERLLCPQKLPATCLTQLLVQIAHLTGVHVQTSDNDRRGQLLVLVAVLKSGKSRRLATKSLVAKVAGNFSSPKLRLRKLLGTFGDQTFAQKVAGNFSSELLVSARVSGRVKIGMPRPISAQ